MRDARFFASCVEGVQDLNEIDPDHYTAVLETKVAYLKFKFNVTVEVTRADPPREIEAKIEGTPLGIVGRLTATSVTRLAEEGGGTKVSYEIDAALTGKLGSLGQPVLRSKAKEMERQFAERMRAAFAPAAKPANGSRHDAVRTCRTDVAARGRRAARSRRLHGAADRRRHRADADDEGRRVPADAARQPAQARASSMRASQPAPTARSPSAR